MHTLKLKPLSQPFQALLQQSDRLKSRWKPSQGEESTADTPPRTRQQSESTLLSFPGLKGMLEVYTELSAAMTGHGRPTQARGGLNLTGGHMRSSGCSQPSGLDRVPQLPRAEATQPPSSSPGGFSCCTCAVSLYFPFSKESFYLLKDTVWHMPT